MNFIALICANDLLALGSIRALTRAGLRIPKDVSVIGYDDIEFAASASVPRASVPLASVPRASVRQPTDELGHAAANLVISACEDPASHAHQRVKFQPQLIPRQSSAQVGAVGTLAP